MGMAGNLSAAISLFEEYQAKRDMQFPSTLALAFFHRRLPSIDQELLDQLHSEASVSEDVTVITIRLFLYLYKRQPERAGAYPCR